MFIKVPESLATENPVLPVKTAQSLGSISFTFGHRIVMVESETFLIAVLNGGCLCVNLHSQIVRSINRCFGFNPKSVEKSIDKTLLVWV